MEGNLLRFNYKEMIPAQIDVFEGMAEKAKAIVEDLKKQGYSNKDIEVFFLKYHNMRIKL